MMGRLPPKEDEKTIHKPKKEPTPISKEVCKYHQNGGCKFGTKCKNLHLPKDSNYTNP